MLPPQRIRCRRKGTRRPFRYFDAKGNRIRDPEVVDMLKKFSGVEPLETALAGYQSRRDAAVMSMFEMTCDLA